MTCREMLEFLLQYLENELPGCERQTFEEHLAECPDCVAYLDTYQQVIRLSQKACAPADEMCQEMPEGLVQAILATRPKPAVPEETS